MVISPDYIIKVLSSEADAKNLCEGNLILRSRHYYLNCAGEAKDSKVRQDPQEFRQTCSIKGERYHFEFSDDALIFCASHYIRNDQSDFGKFFVKISNPCGLLQEISGKLKLAFIDDFPGIFGKIRYSDFKNYEQFEKTEFYCFPVYMEENYIGFPSTIDPAFNKDKFFESQNEVRMIFIVNPEKLIPRQGLEVKFCKREDSKNPPKEFRDYKEWYNSKYEDDIGREDYWFEIYMKVSNNYFSRL